MKSTGPHWWTCQFWYSMANANQSPLEAALMKSVVWSEPCTQWPVRGHPVPRCIKKQILVLLMGYGRTVLYLSTTADYARRQQTVLT